VSDDAATRSGAPPSTPGAAPEPGVPEASTSPAGPSEASPDAPPGSPEAAFTAEGAPSPAAVERGSAFEAFGRPPKPSDPVRTTARFAIAQLKRPVTKAVKLWRLIVAVIVGYRGEALALRAGNLTFITITSLVPLAAVILSLLHLLNEQRIDALVMRFFEDILSPGGRAQSEATIRKFLSAGGSRAAGSVSFFVFLVSSGILLRHLDASLNDVWAVRRKRPILVSIALYTGMLFFGPLAMGIALLGTDGMKQLVLWAELPYSDVAFALGAMASACLVFALLFKLAPHAPVPWRSALTGGAVAGIAWELARQLYGGIASFFFSANPLYGSLGIAPLFLMWIYVSWYIVLSGARLAYAVEHADFHDEFADLLTHPRSAELIATRIASLVTRAALTNAKAPTTRSLAQELHLPQMRVIDLVHQLTEKKLLVVQRSAILPARDPSTLTLADISAAVGGAAAVPPERISSSGRFEEAERLFSAIDEATVQRLKGISWTDLAAPSTTTEKP